MKFEKTFGDIIKKFREQRNLPLREVAEAMKIDTSMLGKIEKNNRKPTKQFIEKFANFFQVSNKDLMIAFLSDTVAYKLMGEEDYAIEVLKVAEEKVEHLKIKKNQNK